MSMIYGVEGHDKFGLPSFQWLNLEHVVWVESHIENEHRILTVHTTTEKKIVITGDVAETWAKIFSEVAHRNGMNLNLKREVA